MRLSWMSGRPIWSWRSKRTPSSPTPDNPRPIRRPAGAAAVGVGAPPRSRLRRRDIRMLLTPPPVLSSLSYPLARRGVHSLSTSWPWWWPRVLSRSRLPRSAMCASWTLGLSGLVSLLGTGLCFWSADLPRSARAHACHRARVPVPFLVLSSTAHYEKYATMCWW